MMARVSSDIRLSGTPPDVRKTIGDELTLDNPAFVQAVKLGLKTWRIPRTLSLMWTDGEDIHVPAGYLSRILAICPSCEVVMERPDIPGVTLGDVPLSPVQDDAVSRCVRVLSSPLVPLGGCLIGPCGCGKTRMGLAIASRIGKPTLWLSHKIQLVEQARDSAREFMPDGLLAVTKGGKLSISDGITFATVQTMAAADLSPLRDRFGLVIVDECHHCVGTVAQATQFSTVLNALNCPKLGLTATPARADGLEPAMTAILGPTLYTIGRDDIASRFCPVVLYQIEAYPDIRIRECLDKTGTVSSAKLMGQLVDDEVRTRQIATTVQSAPKPCLVLASRLSLLADLADLIPGAVLLKSDRESRADVTLATYQLVSEGYDRPDLQTVVLATPESDRSRIIQSVGRVQRAHPSKTQGIVIDIVDVCEYIRWSRMAGKRAAIINSLNVD